MCTLHVNMYLYTCTCKHVLVHMYMYTCTHVHVHVYMYVCFPVHINTVDRFCQPVKAYGLFIASRPIPMIAFHRPEYVII